MSGLPVDVIVPVFKQYDLVQQCLTSLLAADCKTAHNIIVIDDCSLELELNAYLGDLADGGSIELHTNRENLGFTRTVNFGMQLHPDRDVVLLNSDTIVYPQWLDRLQDAMRSADDVATANPLTNQFGSHISCYPGLVRKFADDLEVDDQRLDAIAREVNAGRRVPVHTTVGFCMYIARRALDDIGYFDAVNFPVAYGEESDFCYRAAKAGWRHLIAGDVFVTHLEGQSYGERKAQMMADMVERIMRLHPEVPQRDQQFQATDPLRPLRAAVDLGRIRRLLDGASSIVVASAGDRPAKGRAPSILFDQVHGDIKLQVPTIPDDSLPNIGRLTLPRDIARFNAVLSALGVRQLAFPSRKTCEAFESATARTHPDELGLAVATTCLT